MHWSILFILEYLVNVLKQYKLLNQLPWQSYTPLQNAKLTPLVQIYKVVICTGQFYCKLRCQQIEVKDKSTMAWMDC